MNEEFIFVLFFAVLLVIFFIPSIVAFLRGYHYKWIILALNIFGGALFGVGWIVALIWALWPSETGIADIVVNDPTTNSSAANRKIYSRYGENFAAFNEAMNAKFCPNCGNKIQTNATFCPICGNKL